MRVVVREEVEMGAPEYSVPRVRSVWLFIREHLVAGLNPHTKSYLLTVPGDCVRFARVTYLARGVDFAR